MEVMEAVFQRILEGLRADPDTLVPLESQPGDAEPAEEALLWTRLFLARHYDRLGRTGTPPPPFPFPPCSGPACS